MKKKKAIYRTAHSSMPLPAYTWAHIEAELSKEDREKLEIGQECENSARRSNSSFRK